jgi:hypothetical protein
MTFAQNKSVSQFLAEKEAQMEKEDLKDLLVMMDV